MSSIQRRPLWRRCAAALGLAAPLLAGLGAAGDANAQNPPTISLVAPAAVLEGNAGTRTMTFRITLDVLSASQVSGRFQTRQGSSPNDATEGSTCTGETDYIKVDQAFVIPPFSPGTSVDVVICGDTRREPTVQEPVRALLNLVSGARCTTTSCSAIGLITEDDDPGFIFTNDVSVSRIAFGFGSVASIPVTLSRPSGLTTTVDFTTAAGTVQGGLACADSFFGPAFQTTSGRVTFLPGQQSATVRIPVCKTAVAPEGNFSVLFSNPTAGAGISFDSRRAVVTLLAATASLPSQPPTVIGVFGFSPDNARVGVDETVNFALEWTLPPGQAWRDLSNIGMRVRSNKKTLLWINWNESSNLFSLCQRRGVRVGAYHFYGHGSELDLDEDDGDESPALAVSCSAGALPGSDTVLETGHARLHLGTTRVQGSGPTGASVVLHMSVSFKPGARGKSYIELAASNDAGQVDAFVRAASLKVVGHQDD